MKKITFYFVMLFSITAFSQIEIVDDFDNESNNSVPSNWTGDMEAGISFVCDGTGLTAWTFLPAGQSASLVSQNYSAISNGTALTASFSYNIFERTSQFPGAQSTAPAADWGSLVLEYSTDGGTNWTAISTIDSSNYTFVDATTCQNVNVSVGSIADGSDFQVRFATNIVNVTGFRTVVLIDNVSITQVADTVPNCDAMLTSPLNGVTDVDTDLSLTWQPATGLATGYKVSVGTTSGGTDIVDAAITTETSYALSGLNYVTEYFVTIVPFNDEGDATGCTEESFTTRAEPIAGATCSSPIEVASYPFIDVTSNTANFENNIDDNPCSSSYMNGNDVFYEITPTTDVSVNIEVNGITPATSNRAGLMVFKDCPDSATECLASDTSFSGDSRSLLDVVLLAGNTYFVVLSTSNASNTFEYILSITQNSCINPTINSVTAISDCDNGQFTVDVDVSYLGSATSLTLSDDDTTSADITNITATGVYTAGPYASGTLVNFTLTNDDDSACLYADSAYFYCPPTNDECGSPISLTVNTDDTCTIFTSASNAGATQSSADPDVCASTTNNTNDVWFSFVAASETTILEYLNIETAPGFNTGGTIQATELLEGTCGELTSLSCYTTNYVTFTGLTIGNTYYIRNNTRLSGEYAQNYDICLRNAPAPPANDECANAAVLTTSTDETCNNAVTGTTVGATLSSNNSCNTEGYGDVWYVFNPTATAYYEFVLTRGETSPSTYYSIYEGACGSFTEITTSCNSNSEQVALLDSTSTYYIMVQSSQVGEGITFDLCVTELPPAQVNSDCSAAISFNESPDATGANRISGNLDNAYYSPEGACSSTYATIWYEFTPSLTGTYNFELIRTSGSAYYTVYDSNVCSTDLGYLGGDINSCFESGTDSGPVEAGTTYLVSIQASSAAEFEFFAYPDPALSLASNEMDSFKYYPNPVKNELTVEAKSAISHVSVHNIVGQKVKEFTPNSVMTLINMNELNTGVYFVTVMINNSKNTIRVIKE
ncbi:T9SS type A sorting domain-containing protein [Winogradskyella sediminis]|uniref:Por secretion system C-terminal sorting domain-containing protein n=1 Tax=Winogradskyella sediminis TaxID=1382466 RepID=A0A1H1ML57_9FLAO|nr:T9SS type A sorting domain-containing protein [Winogradskyella sediminis]SDR87564.1 Por secretion system C-terminal sorting domain-containing protein [Winogradskyella sediminis]